MKSLKSYVVKICKVVDYTNYINILISLCQEEHGHLVLLGVFDSVDDTVLVSKTILAVRK